MTPDTLPEDTEPLKTALIETRARLSGAEALIDHLQLVIAKMRREKFGPRSERSQRLLDQMELQLEELAAAQGEDQVTAEAAAVAVRGFTRQKAGRRNFPADLPRRRIVHPAPATCPCRGGTKLSRIGEDVTETLDVVPRQWFVTEHVREKFSCRSCETIAVPFDIRPDRLPLTIQAAMGWTNSHLYEIRAGDVSWSNALSRSGLGRRLPRCTQSS